LGEVEVIVALPETTWPPSGFDNTAVKNMELKRKRQHLAIKRFESRRLGFSCTE
jgi:hypothetical protein